MCFNTLLWVIILYRLGCGEEGRTIVDNVTCLVFLDQIILPDSLYVHLSSA